MKTNTQTHDFSLQFRKEPIMNIRLTIVTIVAVCTALCAMPGTARGQMFVSVNSSPFCNGGSNVYQYDSSGNYTVFLSDLDHPRQLAFDSYGNLYVATITWIVDSECNIFGFDHGSILKVSGGVMSTIATFPGVSATGLAIDSGGNVFASAQNNESTLSTIYKVAPNGAKSEFGYVPGQCFSLAFDSVGNLLAAGSDSTLTYGTIYEFDPVTRERSIFVDSPAFSSSGPIGMTFDNNPSHNLFVSTYNPNDGTGDIRSFDSGGTENLPPLVTGLTKNPRGLAFDSTDNLFCAEIGIPGTATTGDILKFDSNGVQTVFATEGFGTRGNRGPEYVAFLPPAAPSPSPPSSAVLLTFPNTTETLITTTVEPVDQNSVPLPPSNFELQTGGPSLAYEISAPANATLPTPIIIGFTVPASVWGLDGSGLKALHYENSHWVDSTIYPGDPNYPSNPASNTIYGSVNSLSPFLVAKQKFNAQVQQPINANGTSVFSVRRGVVPLKFTLTNNGASTCGLPPATIAVTRTGGGTLGSVNESVYSMSADSGSNFRINSCQYVYNLNSNALGAGTYRADIRINGSVVGSANFGLQ
jgi:hypothetical protein